MVFLCLDVTKFKYYISGVDLKRYPEEEVHPCLRREGDTIYLGIYLEGRYSLKEFEHYQRKIQSWLKRHCLGGIAYYGDHSLSIIMTEGISRMQKRFLSILRIIRTVPCIF